MLFSNNKIFYFNQNLIFQSIKAIDLIALGFLCQLFKKLNAHFEYIKHFPIFMLNYFGFQPIWLNTEIKPIINNKVDSISLCNRFETMHLRLTPIL